MPKSAPVTPQRAGLASDPPQGRPIPDAQADLAGLYDWIADQASPEVALAYIERLESYVMGFEVASERGTRHDHIRQGLRTTGFERRLGGKDILNILVTPLSAKIAKQAYLYDLLISDRSVILYQPEFPAGTAASLRLSLYIPDDDDFQNFANRLLSHDAMSCVIASFADIPGWIEYDESNPSTLPSHTRDALQKITSYSAQLMEHEGLHGFCYVRKRWREIQQAIGGEEQSDLIICALNPFRLIDMEKVSLVTNQLSEDNRAIFTEGPELGFNGRLSRIAKRAVRDCIDANHLSWLEFPYWGGMVTQMVETVFADHIGFRPTGMFRDAYVGQLAATRRFNADFPSSALDVERLQVDDIVNWLRAWQFMEACGFVAGEAE